MVDILHRVGMKAPQPQVYAAIATADGVSTWWTHDVTGDAAVGGKLEFRFGSPEPSAVMEIIDLTPPDRVEWRCVQGPAEWVDTHVRFELSEIDDETAVRFWHAGWREPIAFMHHCSTKWAHFLLGLKAGLEGRGATPYPGDLKISSWG